MFRIGLIGNRAHQMLFGPIFEDRSDCRIIAAAEHHVDKARALEQRFNIKCAQDYDAVLEDPNVDFVSIATDFYLKRPLILKAIACGKHVLVDKPIGRTVQEAREIAQAARDARIKIVLTYPLRFQASLSKLARAVQNGEYARVASFNHHWVRQYPDSDLMDYVSYPTPARINGGGELMNNGSHAVDYVYSVFGMPKRVHCLMENHYWDEYRPFGTEDFAIMTLDYGNFSTRTVTGRTKVARELPVINTIDLVCDGRYVRIDNDDYTINGEHLDVPAAPLPPRESTVQHLIDCIVHDRAPQSGVHNGLAVAEIVTAAYQSAQSGGFITLPLVDELHPLISTIDQTIDGLLD